MTRRVGWLFSMARSGSSAVCYAAAAPWRLPVADEPFGPWDRTGPPFFHPPVQLLLRDAFARAQCRLTPDVAALAAQLFDELAGRHDRLICKIPHEDPDPALVRSRFGPHHRVAFLLRNPLHRLNSLYRRGWLAACGPGFDLERFKRFARRWRAHPGRLVYDQLRTDPHAFFTALYRAWRWPVTRADLDVAVAYVRTRYHHRSRRVDPSRDPSRVLAETELALPPEAVETYLNDPFVRELMVELGWSTDPADYLPAMPGPATTTSPAPPLIADRPRP